MPQVRIKGFNIGYRNVYDVSSIIEVFAMDVYRISSVAKGDVVLDLGAGISGIYARGFKDGGRRWTSHFCVAKSGRVYITGGERKGDWM